MNFKDFLSNFTKFDTYLAFITSSIIYYLDSKNIKKSLYFSIKFVIVFLFLLNLFK